MTFDPRTVDPHTLERHIEAIRLACQHAQATRWRLDTITTGGTAPTLGSDDDTRVFAFPPTIATAAYLAQFRAIDFDALRRDLATVQLPHPEQFEIEAAHAREAARYRGLRKLFTSRPEAGLRALEWMSTVDVDTVYAVLSGVDATLGSTPTNEFTGLSVSSLRPQIEDDLRRITGWPVTWVDASRVNDHVAAASSIGNARAIERQLENEVHAAARALTAAQAEAELARTDIAVLDAITETRLRLGPISHLGVREIARCGVAQLTTYNGVGEKTATQAIAAARSYVADVEASQVPRIDYKNKGPSTEYVRALARLLTYRDGLREVPVDPLHLAPVEPGVPVAIAGVDDLLAARVYAAAAPEISAEEAWNLYAIRAAEFHAFGDAGGASEVPEEIAEAISKITLRGTLHASLRGYQAFGAKFALAQNKVLIGDEMGLGKTMQALAVLAHKAALGETRAVVVCPPSLRINWSREIAKFTDLECFVLHGPGKEAAWEAWRHKGGVAIAGYPEVRGNVELTGAGAAGVDGGDGNAGAGDSAGAPVDVLIVDEAHRAKNPESLQSQGVKALTAKAGCVMYLTGTPLENRVAEFETLLSYLDPQMPDALEKVRCRAQGFSKAIAGVYLRRNQSDVLDELPGTVEVAEWIEPKKQDEEEYLDALDRGHFMDMRQAFAGPESAKMERVMELLEDGAEEAKTIIFTYFRSVLDDLMAALGPRAYGPIAGGVSHADRQKAVDEFTAAEPGAVLVCQITAASEGLNIQAANRIILFEPQLNPAVEAQAIARAHRMGQVNVVEVHRLLTPDSVEERLTEMLEHKRALFDRYARDSVAAASDPSAMDVSEAELIRQVIAQERERVGKPETLIPEDGDA